ncbi:hypothetical protein CEXT_717321 [Caerostris extrusa]|uniref:Uncharacterized protein n=1 Tax=Caerostris extrusa TaxID=172846 RepID=A0AAV4Y3I4_CAEEX|nr:hypothetical protein CEXT_717321 [Caerostris extrusa]
MAFYLFIQPKKGREKEAEVKYIVPSCIGRKKEAGTEIGRRLTDKDKARAASSDLSEVVYRFGNISSRTEDHE